MPSPRRHLKWQAWRELVAPAIGVIFAIMTWLLAAGVVFILGPVVGTAWTAWRRERRANGLIPAE
jgi:hypothetical protein